MNNDQNLLDFSRAKTVDAEAYDKLKALAEGLADNDITGAGDGTEEPESGRKYYIHKTNAFNFKREHEMSCVGSESAKARNIRDIEKGDKILFLMPINSRSEETGLPCKKLMFVAAAAAGDRFASEKPIIGYDLCETKLKIEELEFFEFPVSGEVFLKASPDGHSTAKAGTISDVVKTEYKRIENSEFDSVLDTVKRQAGVPEYLKEIFDSCQPEPGSRVSKKYKVKEMIAMVNCAISVYSMIRNEEEKARITDVLEFISAVFDAAGVNKSLDELKEIYSKIGRYVDFEHIHTRDAGKGVKVLDGFGNISRFGYIKFDRKGGEEKEN